MPSLGEQFRAAREARGITLSEAAERIRIRSVYLQAIEEEDWPSIGAAVYVRGFLRTYARFLGLDPERAVASFNDITGIQPPSAAMAAEEELLLPPRSGPSVWVWLGGIVAVALLAIVGYSFWQLEAPRGGPPVTAAAASPQAPAASAAAPAGVASPGAALPQATAPASPEPLASGLETVTLTFTAPSWVRVIVDGKQVSEGIFAPSEVRTYRGGSIRIRIGNAGGVDVQENGHDLGTLGGPGDVVDRVFTADAN